MSIKNPRARSVASKKKQLIGVKQDNGYYKTVRICSKGGRPLWHLFLEFFDSIKIGEQFSRYQLIHAMYEKGVAPAMTSSLSSVDTYRGYLKTLGLITSIKPGLYEKQFNLPTDMKLTTIRKALKERWSWGWWFKPLHKKLNIEEKDLK
jgi:hypothetical protein